MENSKGATALGNNGGVSSRKLEVEESEESEESKESDWTRRKISGSFFRAGRVGKVGRRGPSIGKGCGGGRRG